MKFKTCYLHIGTEKTGSTSIQRYMEKNRKELQKRGHYYPKCLGPRRGSHYYLVVYSRHEDIFDDLRLISNVNNVEDLYKFREKLETDINIEFSQIENCENLHISCENFHSRLIGIESIKKTKTLLDPWVENFKVISYIRPQHEVALSLYSTDMKLGGIKKNPLPAIDEDNHYYNYDVMLNKWETVFGINNMVVKVFQRSSLFMNDIIYDYLKLTGIDYRGLCTIENENESLSPLALEFLGRLNTYLPRFVNNKPTYVRNNLAEVMEKIFQGNGAITSRGNAENFYAKFNDSNRKVALKFFKKESLFDINFNKYTELDLNTELSIDDTLYVFSEFVNHLKIITICDDKCAISLSFLNILFNNKSKTPEDLRTLIETEIGKMNNCDDILVLFASIWKCCTLELKD